MTDEIQYTKMSPIEVWKVKQFLAECGEKTGLHICIL